MAKLTLLLTLALTAVVSLCVAPGAATAAVRKPAVTVRPATVVQQDPVTISGATTQRRVTVYRKLSGGAWTRIGGARSHHGRFSFRTKPVAGRTNHYRTSAAGRAVTSRSAAARSIGCTPLAAHGTVATWVQDAKSRPTLTTHWRQLICSAAPHSTITMAEMFVYENSASVVGLMSALRAVHYYRGVHVRVLVQRNGYYPGAQWASLKRHFAFAEVHYCLNGCRSAAPTAHAHTKFVVLSKTVFGRPAVLESSANWSADQLDRLPQSGVYVYGNAPLTRAFLQEWSGLATRAPLAAAAWRPVGSGIWYAFDPRPAPTDLVTSELQGLTCRPGDSVGVVDTLLTRKPLVTELTRLATAGCSVLALIDPTGTVAAAMGGVTHTVAVHDKFVVIDAHVAATGAVRHEVVHGSENFSTGSMTMSDQQLLMIRRADVFASYTWWFDQLWHRSTPLPVSTSKSPPKATQAVVRASACARPASSVDNDDDAPAGSCAAG